MIPPFSASVSFSECLSMVLGSSSVDQAYAEIVVVRHGETSWNAERKIQVAERLSMEPKISYVYASDLKSAFETAQIIAAQFGNLEVLRPSPTSFYNLL
ncbi:hypothetical protein N665_0527s0043 [Sinapis alba]|nr:hypothetical protein N665_0527s0043 [Sinapis alba]